jgi:hypothetical protein
VSSATQMRYNGHSRERTTEREMVIETSESDENSRLARSHTDPLWLQDHFLGTGHDVTTRNGTASFANHSFSNRGSRICRRPRQYYCSGLLLWVIPAPARPTPVWRSASRPVPFGELRRGFPVSFFTAAAGSFIN